MPRLKPPTRIDKLGSEAQACNTSFELVVNLYSQMLVSFGKLVYQLEVEGDMSSSSAQQIRANIALLEKIGLTISENYIQQQKNLEEAKKKSADEYEKSLRSYSELVFDKRQDVRRLAITFLEGLFDIVPEPWRRTIAKFLKSFGAAEPNRPVSSNAGVQAARQSRGALGPQ